MFVVSRYLFPSFPRKGSFCLEEEEAETLTRHSASYQSIALSPIVMFAFHDPICNVNNSVILWRILASLVFKKLFEAKGPMQWWEQLQGLGTKISEVVSTFFAEKTADYWIIWNFLSFLEARFNFRPQSIAASLILVYIFPCNLCCD